MSDKVTAKDILLQQISEEDFLQNVIKLAKLGKWKVYHTRDSRRSDPGFPDLFLCRPPRVIIIELKREGKALTPVQDLWIWALLKCPGVESYVWWPSEWDEIERVLK